MALKAAVLGAPAKRLLWAALVGEVAQAAVLGWCGLLGFSRLGWVLGCGQLHSGDWFNALGSTAKFRTYNG